MPQAMRRAVLVAIAVLIAGGAVAHATTKRSLKAVEKSSGRYAFSAKKLTARPGKVTIKLTNSSRNNSEHAIEISGHGIEKDSKRIQPGHSGSVTAKLKKGTYVFYCPVTGH